jgi:hypothetical protein
LTVQLNTDQQIVEYYNHIPVGLINFKVITMMNIKL